MKGNSGNKKHGRTGFRVSHRNLPQIIAEQAIPLRPPRGKRHKPGRPDPRNGMRFPGPDGSYDGDDLHGRDAGGIDKPST
jgi:hypothetical protein